MFALSYAAVTEISTSSVFVTSEGSYDNATVTVSNSNSSLPSPGGGLSGCTYNDLVRLHIHELKLIQRLQKYQWALMFPIALVGNIIAFIGNYEKANRSPPHFYMTVLSVMDFVALAMRQIHFFLMQYHVKYGTTGCHLSRFFTHFFDGFAIWVVVIMTVQRVFVVLMPLRAPQMLTVKGAVMTLVILTALLVLTRIPGQLATLWMYDPARNSIICDIDTSYPTAIPSRWFEAALLSFLPALILVISNFIIIFGISRAGKRQAAMTSGQNKKSLQERQVTVMMLVISISFVALTTPMMVYAMEADFSTTYETCDEFMTFARLAITAYYLFDLNNCINGYLYCISGGTFRRDLSNKLCGFRRRKGQRGSSMSGTTRMTAISTVSTGDVKEGLQ
jgi:hypothetical protein